MNVYLKILFDIADSPNGMIPYSEIESKYKTKDNKLDVRIMSYSAFFEKCSVDGADYLRIRLDGYILANQLRTNNNARIFNVLSFIFSVCAVAVSLLTLLFDLL